MPTRDDQEYELRRQQIIDGALHVFSTHGFERATNKDIADAAGIRSPGLIYHYFRDKADLLRHVIEQRAPVLQLLAYQEWIADLPPREALTRFGEALMATMENPVAISLLKLLLGEAVRRPAVASMVNAIGPGRGLAFIAQYLEQQMDRNVLQRTDPRAAARCFVGPLLAFVVTREVFPQPDTQSLTAQQMVATTVDIFLGGLEVRHT